MSYLNGPEMGVINETTAATADREMRMLLLMSFYPDLAPPPAAENQPPTNNPPQQPPAFDYRREMHKTRVEADRLLAGGKIAQAEAYLESRRQVFWDQGYAIRKLNQAYFAFYGAYADDVFSAAGQDPAGAAVRSFRAQSPSLADFLYKISWFWSFDSLTKAVQASNPATQQPGGSSFAP
jgi:hypothetical protein